MREKIALLKQAARKSWSSGESWILEQEGREARGGSADDIWGVSQGKEEEYIEMTEEGEMC